MKNYENLTIEDLKILYDVITEEKKYRESGEVENLQDYTEAINEYIEQKYIYWEDLKDYKEKKGVNTLKILQSIKKEWGSVGYFLDIEDDEAYYKVIATYLYIELTNTASEIGTDYNEETTPEELEQMLKKINKLIKELA